MKINWSADSLRASVSGTSSVLSLCLLAACSDPASPAALPLPATPTQWTVRSDTTALTGALFVRAEGTVTSLQGGLELKVGCTFVTNGGTLTRYVTLAATQPFDLNPAIVLEWGGPQFAWVVPTEVRTNASIVAGERDQFVGVALGVERLALYWLRGGQRQSHDFDLRRLSVAVSSVDQRCAR